MYIIFEKVKIQRYNLL